MSCPLTYIFINGDSAVLYILTFLISPHSMAYVDPPKFNPNPIPICLGLLGIAFGEFVNPDATNVPSMYNFDIAELPSCRV